MVVGVFAQQFLDPGRHPLCLRAPGAESSARYNVSGVVFGPQRFPFSLGVVFNDGARNSQDVLRRAIILLQFEDWRAGEVALEVQDVFDVRSPELVNRLIFVSYHEKVGVARGKQAEQLVLWPIRILILVDENVAVPVAVW